MSTSAKTAILRSSSARQFSKHRADWFILDRRTVKQCFVGALSHLRGNGTLSPESVRAYFRKQYLDPFDDLIFDGNDFRYHAQLERDLSSLEGSNVVDFGCGKATFYTFLVSQSVDFKSYFGVDFATEGREFASNARTIQSDAKTALDTLSFKGPAVAVFCNSACYMQDQTLATIACDARIEGVLLLEPYPGFFWDRSFNRISPKYRYPEQLMRLIEACGYGIKSSRLFYAISKTFPVWPICYSMLFTRDRKAQTESES